MALFVPFEGVGQFGMRFEQQGQQVENVYHLRFEVAPDATTLLAACATLKGWWDAQLKTTCTAGVALNSIVGTDLSTDIGASVEYVAGLPLLGTNTGNDMPMNVTMAVKWLTAVRGRSFRGRTYHIGLTEAMIVGSTVDAGLLLTFTEAYDALITDVAGIPAELVVASRRHAGVARTIGVATPITSSSIDSTVDSQRRRLPGRGR